MRRLAIVIYVLGVGAGLANAGQGGSPGDGKDQAMVEHAKGTFEVKITPVDTSALGKQAAMGRMTIDKKFSGALEGFSQGEMLTGITESSGAMAYVAIERVTGKLDGHQGTFILMHNATMMKNDPKSGQMNITVVPASGTEALAGLTGKMNIIIDRAGKHSYDFEYTLP